MGDEFFSVRGMSANSQLSICSGRAYIASKKTRWDKAIRHGILPASQASLSVIFTIKTVKPDATTSAMTSARSVLGPGIDLEGVLCVTTTPLPPTSLKKRLRRAGHFENGVSLLRSPTEKQASDYHRLGTTHGAEEGETSRFVFEDKHVNISVYQPAAYLRVARLVRGIGNNVEFQKSKLRNMYDLVCE